MLRGRGGTRSLGAAAAALTAGLALLFAGVSPATAAGAVEPDVAPLDSSAPGTMPEIGDCTYAASWGPFNMDGGVVDCEKPHTGQTVYVGRWTSKVSPAKADVVSEKKRNEVVDDLRWEIDRCDEASQEYLGFEVRRSVYRLSEFYVYVTGPNPEQWNAGERWLRCDVIAFKSPASWAQTANSWLNLPTQLRTLPAPRHLKGILARPDLGRFTQCQQRRDGSGWYDLFTCKKGIEIVAGIEPRRDFDNVDATRRHVEKRCVAVIEDLTGKSVPRGQVVALSSGCPAVATAWVCGIARD